MYTIIMTDMLYKINLLSGFRPGKKEVLLLGAGCM